VPPNTLRRPGAAAFFVVVAIQAGGSDTTAALRLARPDDDYTTTTDYRSFVGRFPLSSCRALTRKSRTAPAATAGDVLSSTEDTSNYFTVVS